MLVMKRKLSLCEIGLTHSDLGHGRLIGGGGIVEIELRGRVLGIQWGYAVEIVLGLASLRLRLVEYGTGLVDVSLIHLRVDYEECLTLVDMRSFLETHLFEVALHTGMYLYKLLGADAAHILAVDIYVASGDGLHLHLRQRRLLGFGAQKET